MCDGYTLNIVPTKIVFETPLISKSLSNPRFENYQESLYFRVFLSRISRDSLSAFDSDILRQALLQLSECNHAIRHVIVAIGALDKKFEMEETYPRSSLDQHGHNPVRIFNAWLSNCSNCKCLTICNTVYERLAKTSSDSLSRMNTGRML